MKISVLIPTTGDIATVREHAVTADQLGYDSINCSHIAARDSFTTLAGLAHLAPSVTLATAVAPIYHRSPASMAQTAATVDDLSGGRFRLGLGTGHRATMGGWHGQDIGNPVAEMREYAALVRALLAGTEPPENHSAREKKSSRIYCAASVAMTRYSPFSRAAGTPKIRPTSAVTAPAIGMAKNTGIGKLFEI